MYASSAISITYWILQRGKGGGGGGRLETERGLQADLVSVTDTIVWQGAGAGLGLMELASTFPRGRRRPQRLSVLTAVADKTAVAC